MPLAVATATKPRAIVTATYTPLPTGKVRVRVTSDARKVLVKYRTAKNKKRALTRKLKRGGVAFTLPVGSRLITVRAKATTKMAASPWITATPFTNPSPVPKDVLPGGGTDRPRATCFSESARADDGVIDLTLSCLLGTYTPNPLLGVRVYAFTDSTFTQLAPAAAANPVVVTPGELRARFEGLANNRRYFFQTSAFDVVGEGGRSYVGGLEEGVHLYRHHRVSDVRVVGVSRSSFQATWTPDPTDARAVTSVIIGLHDGLVDCGDAGCSSIPDRRVIQTPESSTDWAARFDSGILPDGTWCLSVTLVDEDGPGFPSSGACVILSPSQTP
jgi:hypothetical protein